MTKRERIALMLSEILHEKIEPAQEYTRQRTETWDSLNHLRIVLAFEEEFGLALGPEEVQRIQSLSDLECIAERGQ
jgi:acyl carrier protein